MARIIQLNVPIWSDRETQEGAAPFWFYCITEAGEEETGPCKVGVATKFKTRLSSLQGGNRRRLTVAWLIRIADRRRALDVESYCLGCLRPSIYGGHQTRRSFCSEWVDATPAKALSTAFRLLNCEDEEEFTRVVGSAA